MSQILQYFIESALRRKPLVIEIPDEVEENHNLSELLRQLGYVEDEDEWMELI